jgi:hypothetical protein
MSDFELDQAGRITQPMVLRPGATHYQPLDWQDAFDLIARELNALESPDEAVFYTSGRASNEAAFLYQLFVRDFGTNNLPDCSNMCHESSGLAMNTSVGVGKGTVTLRDLECADVIIVAGQNPGTNHPRMLSTLQKAVDGGTHIIAVNPLREAGLSGFMHPQHISGAMGKATALAKDFQDVAGREDMKELGDVRTHSKLGPLVFIECRHLADRHVALDRKRSDDPPLIGLLVVRCGHGEFLGWPECEWTVAWTSSEQLCVRALSGQIVGLEFDFNRLTSVGCRVRGANGKEKGV